jgi:hypothetical protein
MNCPLPRYYLCHAIVSLAIAAVLWFPLGLAAGLAAGVGFYAGREFTQWEGGLPFDWKGIAVPFVACLVVLLFSRVFM